MTLPIVKGLKKTVLQNQSIAASELFEVTPGSNAITSYFFEDFNTSASGGYFTLNGVAMTQGQRFEVSVADLVNLRYIGGNSVSSERIRVYARDSAGQTSNQTVVAQAFTVKPTNTAAPFAKVTPFTVVADEYAVASNFITGWDPDGYPIQTFRVRDVSANNGYFELDGVRKTQGTFFQVNADDLSKLRYYTKNPGSTETIEVSAFDGVRHSLVASGVATTLQNASQPIVRYVSQNILGTSTANLPKTTSWTDADQNSIKKFQFYNDSVNPNHGDIVLKGAVLPRRTWITVDSADFNQLIFRPKNVQNLPVQTIKYTAYDGTFWSQGINQIDFQTTYVIPPTKPVFTSTATEFYDAQRQAISISSMFAKRDTGIPYVSYEVYDPQTDSPSGYFTSGNVVQSGGSVRQYTAQQFAGLNYVTAAYEDHRRETIYIRANNGQFWGNWEKVDITDYPEIWRATNSNSSWFDQPMFASLPTNGLGQRQLSYSFMQEFPDYETGEAIDGDPAVLEHFSRFTEIQRASVRIAFEHMEEFLNLEFVEIADTETNVLGQRGGIFRFGEYGIPFPDSTAAAFAFFPSPDPQAGDVWLNRLNMPDLDLVRGTETFGILIHELGHALGLKHPHDGFGRLPETVDSWSYTVMSYNPMPVASTYQLYDMHQLQSMYGTNNEFRSGNEIYTVNAPGFLQDSTLWDPAGMDMISFAGGTSNSVIDLRQGMRSTFGTGATAIGLRIAIGTDVERAFGGNQRDVIYGNALDNALTSSAGNDVLIPGKGNDFLRAGAGDDTYVFGVGDGFDVIQEQGLGGNDTLVISQLNQFLGLTPNLATVGFPGMDFLEDDVVFRRIANDLVVDLRLNRGDSQGTTRISNHFLSANDQIESLNFYGVRVDLADLGTKIVGENVNHRFQVTANVGANGFLAALV